VDDGVEHEPGGVAAEAFDGQMRQAHAVFEVADGQFDLGAWWRLTSGLRYGLRGEDAVPLQVVMGRGRRGVFRWIGGAEAEVRHVPEGLWPGMHRGRGARGFARPALGRRRPRWWSPHMRVGVGSRHRFAPPSWSRATSGCGVGGRFASPFTPRKSLLDGDCR
jgi:hypothetical protein